MLGGIGFFLLSRWRQNAVRAQFKTTQEKVDALFSEAFFLGLVVVVFFMVLALIDLLYQKWRFREEMKMTKEEVKREKRESEGDSQIKDHRRDLANKM